MVTALPMMPQNLGMNCPLNVGKVTSLSQYRSYNKVLDTINVDYS